jgi:hypothetical protein
MSKRVRMRLVDINQALATFILPCDDDVDWGIAVSINNAYQEVCDTATRQLVIQTTDPVTPLEPVDGETCLVADVAVLTFTSNGPFGLKLPLLGPGDIFLEDDVTIDMENDAVLDLVGEVLAWGTDRAGNALIECKGGKRVGAGGP